jgi:hypothetical protein
MNLFSIFSSIILFADAKSFAQLDWTIDENYISHITLQPSLEPDILVESSWSTASSLWGPSGDLILDDFRDTNPIPEDILFLDVDVDDANSIALFEETTNNSLFCEHNDNLPVPGKARAARSFCSTDQKPKKNQQDQDLSNKNRDDEDDANPEIEIPDNSDDDPSRFLILDGIPLVDFRSISRDHGAYCPTFFYDTLTIPVCASENRDHITKSYGVYYNLYRAMLSMLTPHPTPPAGMVEREAV